MGNPATLSAGGGAMRSICSMMGQDSAPWHSPQPNQKRSSIFTMPTPCDHPRKGLPVSFCQARPMPPVPVVTGILLVRGNRVELGVWRELDESKMGAGEGGASHLQRRGADFSGYLRGIPLREWKGTSPC